MAAADPAFEGAGRAEGLELWRIESLAPVKQPQVDGKFYTGDSYILLRTYKKGPSLQWNLHFWLGADSSQDERGIAAYKAVELDDALGGAPVQYRETQENESALFLSYFTQTGIEYLPGGVASGFRKVERDVYPTRLLRVKGARVPRSKEVPLNNSSLNTDDVFILDDGLKLFLYNGKEANRQEKAKGLELVHRIRDNERGGRAEVIIVNEDPHNPEFWGLLGGEIEVTVKSEESDDASDKTAAKNITLSRVTDASGTLEMTPIQTEDGKLTRDLLDTNDTFILDTSTELYVWIGKKATAEEKKSGMAVATKFLEQSGRPDSTPITRIIEGGETAVFKSLFKQWDPPRQLTFGFQGSKGVALSPTSAQSVDVKGMMERVQQSEAPVDDGSGKLQIWRIENLELAEVPKEKYGHFYSGDSYIAFYEYQQGSKPAYIIYFWQGNASTADEKAASALHAVELDNKYDGAPVQVRVVQGKEPAHFRQLFKGKMIVHTGGVQSGFKNAVAEEAVQAGCALYHVKGTNTLNTYAVQVQAAAGSLNSGDCFVLVLPDKVMVWKGQGSNDDEKEIAVSVANNLKTSSLDVVTVDEGEESEEFWSALGGKADYPKLKAGEELPKEARLFQLSNATGSMRVDEVFDFSQTDLVPDDVMILDTFTTVFVWVGSGANEAEKSQAMKVAQEYIDLATDGRDSHTPIVKVNAGSEPLMFTQHFIGWDSELASRNVFVDPYEARIAKLKEESTSKSSPPSAWSVKKKGSTPTSPKSADTVSFATTTADTDNADKPPMPLVREPTPAPFARPSINASGGPPSPSTNPASPRFTPGKLVSPRASHARKDSMNVSGSGTVIMSSTGEPLGMRDELRPPVPPLSVKASSPTAQQLPPAPGSPKTDVDPTKKEWYLSDDEFAETFKMTKTEFYALPKWRQVNLKKAAGLF